MLDLGKWTKSQTHLRKDSVQKSAPNNMGKKCEGETYKSNKPRFNFGHFLLNMRAADGVTY